MTEIDKNRIRICKRCGYNWFGRSDIPPKVCPLCSSPYWAHDKLTREEKSERIRAGIKQRNEIRSQANKSEE